MKRAMFEALIYTLMLFGVYVLFCLILKDSLNWGEISAGLTAAFIAYVAGYRSAARKN